MCEPKGEMTALVTGGAAISAARWRMTFPMAANSSRRAGTGQLDDHAANFAAHATAVAGHDVCGWQPCDLPLRPKQGAVQPGPAMSFTILRCRGHHRELHRHGDEAAWWSKIAIDPLAPALELWRATHRALS